MSFLDLFFNSQKSKGKAHVKNLLSVAMVDGVIEDSEYEFLIKIAVKYGFNTEDVEKFRLELVKKGGFTKQSGVPRFEQIYELINMMMIDNHINPKELQMCKVFARKIGVAMNKVDELLDSIVMNISSGHNLEETKLRVGYLVKD